VVAATIAEVQEEDAGCKVAPLTPVADRAIDNVWAPAAKPGWKVMKKSYELADKSLRFDVLISTDPTSSAVRVMSNLTALTTLTSCVGGLAILKLTLPHTEPTITSQAICRSLCPCLRVYTDELLVR